MRSDLFDEHILQYIKPGLEGEADIVIGLDFGTSASKVVIQLPGLPGNPAFAVDFGPTAHHSMPFLLPTRIWISPDGECSLDERPGSKVIEDIKLELFEDERELDSNRGPTQMGYSPEETAVAYLALLLRYARQWFLAEKVDLIGHIGFLNWAVNLGIPSPCAEESRAKQRFQRVGKAAWMLSVLENRISITNANRELQLIIKAPEYWDRDDDGFTCDFATIPEIAAGAVGYASASFSSEGLHVIIDVGAATIDACCFNLSNNSGNQRYALLTADVKQLGTVRLHHERIRAVSQAYARQAQELRDNHDPLTPIAKDVDEYLPAQEGILKAISLSESNLKDLCLEMVRKLIVYCRSRRDPMAKVWTTELPVLLIGGGNKLEFYKELFTALDPWVRSYVKTSEGVSFPTVPLPKTITDCTPEHNRLAVAWGLSHPEYNIGQIIPADKIRDISARDRIDYEEFYVSNDQT